MVLSPAGVVNPYPCLERARRSLPAAVGTGTVGSGVSSSLAFRCRLPWIVVQYTMLPRSILCRDLS